MTTHKIKRVPVMRDDDVVGIVSRADIVSAIAPANTSRSTLRFTIYSALHALDYSVSNIASDHVLIFTQGFV
jgi:signal-transduction protein with cAMP-binding, CBS, and nucleotidyltransferase domain